MFTKALFISIFILTSSLALSAGPRACKRYFAEQTEAVENVRKYPKSFSAGINEAHYINDLAAEIRRRLKGNVEQESLLHIPQLVPVANHLVNFLSQSKPGQGSKTELMAYDRLIEEARTTIEHSGVSYRWLLLFSYRLTFLMQSKDHEHDRGSIVEQIHRSGEWASEKRMWAKPNSNEVDQVIQHMAKRDILSLPIAIDLGIFAMNRLLADGNNPLGNIKKPIDVDGVSMDSIDMWDHDAKNHLPHLPNSTNFRRYAKLFLTKASLLPPAQRMQAELFFFFMTHEMQPVKLTETQSPEKVRVDMLEQIRDDRPQDDYFDSTMFAVVSDPKWLGPNLVEAGVNIKDRAEVSLWLQQGLEEFIKLHSQVRTFFVPH